MKKSTLRLMTSLAVMSLGGLSFGAAGMTAPPSDKLGFDYLTNGPGTPFEKVEALYKKAYGMQMSQFLSAEDPALKNWQCYGVRANTTVDQLTAIGSVPAKVKALMSSTDGTSTKPQLTDIIEMVPTDGSFVQSPEKAGYIANRFSVTMTTEPPGLPGGAIGGPPGVVEVFFNVPGDISTATQVTYRTASGALVVNQDNGFITATTGPFKYYYCAQN